MAVPQHLVALKDQIEDYVRSRIRQAVRAFADEVKLQLSDADLEALILRTQAQELAVPPAVHPAPLQQQPFVAPPPAPTSDRDGLLVLQFTHECLALGCRDTGCSLCQFNPSRVCERHFAKKYLVGDVLKARCGAPIRVEMTDKAGNPITGDTSSLVFEINLLDGMMYKEKGFGNDDELKSTFKLTKNNKDDPLLQYKTSSGASSSSSANRKVMLKLENGKGTLPDLQVMDSSEALLTGRRPPFRLIVWAAMPDGRMSSAVVPAVSENFVVATRRVKQANKAEIPLVDDHVSKIEHIGRETVKKLADMRTAAAESGVEIQIDERMAKIETVGQFQNLVRVADADSQLRKVMQIILKLSKEKWEEASTHALTAVVPDFRRRVWYPPGHNLGVGLVFNCKYGAVQMRDTLSLAQTQYDGSIKCIVEDQLDPASLDILRDLKASAIKKWSEPRHPGWGIFREPNDPPASLDTMFKPANTIAPGSITVGTGALNAPGTVSTTPGRASPPRDLSAAMMAAGLPIAGLKRTANAAGLGDEAGQDADMDTGDAAVAPGANGSSGGVYGSNGSGGDVAGAAGGSGAGALTEAQQAALMADLTKQGGAAAAATMAGLRVIPGLPGGVENGSGAGEASGSGGIAGLPSVSAAETILALQMLQGGLRLPNGTDVGAAGTSDGAKGSEQQQQQQQRQGADTQGEAGPSGMGSDAAGAAADTGLGLPFQLTGLEGLSHLAQLSPGVIQLLQAQLVTQQQQQQQQAQQQAGGEAEAAQAGVGSSAAGGSAGEVSNAQQQEQQQPMMYYMPGQWNGSSAAGGLPASQVDSDGVGVPSGMMLLASAGFPASSVPAEQAPGATSGANE